MLLDCCRLPPLCWWAVASPLDLLQRLSVVADWFALFQLIRYRMVRCYPALFMYVVTSAVTDPIFLFLDPHSSSYLLPWFTLQCGLLVLKLILVWELVRLVCAQYLGIGNFARILLIVAAVLAACICLVTIPPEIRTPHWRLRDFQLMFMISRWESTVLAGFVLLLSAFFAAYGRPGRRNLTMHRWITTAYLVGDALLWFYNEFAVDRTVPNVLLLSLTTVCFVLWGTLTPAGETQQTVAPVMELDAADRWNAELIAVGRRVLGSAREDHTLADKR